MNDIVSFQCHFGWIRLKLGDTDEKEPIKNSHLFKYKLVGGNQRKQIGFTSFYRSKVQSF